jgi:hypothetical protein
VLHHPPPPPLLLLLLLLHRLSDPWLLLWSCILPAAGSCPLPVCLALALRLLVAAQSC